MTAILNLGGLGAAPVGLMPQMTAPAPNPVDEIFAILGRALVMRNSTGLIIPG